MISRILRQRYLLWFIAFAGAGVIYFVACHGSGKGKLRQENEVVVQWNTFMLYAETHTEGYRGAVAARTYGYIGLAAYESALPGLAGDFVSMQDRFPGILLPPHPDQKYFDIAAALNACYASMMHDFFVSAPDPVDKALKKLQEEWSLALTSQKGRETVEVSESYGRAVAKAVFDWSATDSLGYRANHHNYSRDFIPPVGEGMWVPSSDFPMPPLLPYWGDVRTFIISTSDYIAPPPPPFSTEKNQTYYKQALELVSISKPLSTENQWIAEFWNDDHPGMTFSPPGHWLAITNQVVKMEDPAIEKTIELYLKFGFATSDAMVASWKSKYMYHLLRPETFIQRHIDPTWRPHSPSPSFPAYPSGHAILGAAAAEVLTAVFGDHYQMEDRSHDNNKEVPLKPRRYDSFYAMAKEDALSRILLGVHWRMDSEEGLKIGERIGKEVVALKIERGPDQ